MRVAIFSDINANEQAWTSVLADAELQGIEQFICLGDIVGCGPAPTEVLESVHARANWILAGERDLAVAGKLSLDHFTADAREVIEWTREHLSPGARSFLGGLPLVVLAEGFACAHAEFECPQRFSYLDHAGSIFGSIEAVPQPMLFVGHTRLPSVTEIRPNNKLKTYSMHDYQLKGGCRYVVNVGSVGDCRDGNPRACYCIYDTDTFALEFRRVAFDVPSWDVEISVNKLPITPYVIQVLKRGVSGDGGIPDDFIPGLPAEVVPAPIDFAHPLPYLEIDFGVAMRTRLATTDAEFATSELEAADFEDEDEYEDEYEEEPVVATAQLVAEPEPLAEIAADSAAKGGRGKLIAASIACAASLCILAATIINIQKKKEYRPPPRPAQLDRKPPKPKPNKQPQAVQPPAAVNGPVQLNNRVLMSRQGKLQGDKIRLEKGANLNFAVWEKKGSILWERVKLGEGGWQVALVQSAATDKVEIEIEIDDQMLFGSFVKTSKPEDLREINLGQIILPKQDSYRVTARVLSDPPAAVRLSGIKFVHLKK
jgi:hypothetical protein